MLPLLDARGLTRAYVAGHGRCWARVQVLDGLSLRLQRADRVLVAGARGSGKTTLLHCLTGLRRPDAGTVRWDAAQGVPYRLCAEPSELPFVPPRGIALVDLPDDPRRAGEWADALLGRRGGWLVLASRAAPVAALADRLLVLRDGTLHEPERTHTRRVAEPARFTGGLAGR